MGDTLSNIVSPPKPPDPPPVYTAQDGTIWQTQADADARNREVETNRSRQEARDRGYTGSFGEGGYARFVQDYAPNPDDPGGRWIAPHSSNIDRKGRDVQSSRDVARSEGYEGGWGAGGYTRFADDKRNQEQMDRDQTQHEERMARIEETRADDKEYFDQRLKEIEDERKELEGSLSQTVNETSNKTARSIMWKRLFGRRSLMSSTAQGFPKALGG